MASPLKTLTQGIRELFGGTSSASSRPLRSALHVRDYADTTDDEANDRVIVDYTGTLEGGGGGGNPQGVPGYMPIDANDQLVWRFQDYNVTAVANLGAAGAALAGTLSVMNQRQGVPDGHFGRGLGAAMNGNEGYSCRSPVHSPAWTSLTIAAWVTITRYVGGSNFGRILYKNWHPASWSSPFWSVSLEFGNVNAEDLTVGLTRAAGLPIQITTKLDRHMFKAILNSRPTLVGLTFSNGGNLTAWLNGVAVNSTPHGGYVLDLGTGPWALGDTFAGHVENIGGLYHEVRVCNVERNAAWWLENWKRGMGRSLA